MEKEIAIFKTDSETINVEVLFEDETVWLTQDQMAQMFEKAKSTINEHIKHIFEEGELDESKVTRKFGNTEFSTDVTKPKLYYNLDVIISVGYRVKSLRGTQFRQWGVPATSCRRAFRGSAIAPASSLRCGGRYAPLQSLTREIDN